MSTVGYINVSLEIWGSILSLIIALCLSFSKDTKINQDRVFLWLLSCNAVVLLCDAAAWLFKGHVSPVCYYGVRISNFLSFALSYFLLVLFTQYLTCFLSSRTRVTMVPLRLIQVMCAISLIFVIISQFNHMFYTFDENNVYRRQDWFWLSQVGGIAGMCVNAGLLLKYMKCLTRIERAAFSAYIVLPVAAMAVQIFIYGIALLNLATTVSILSIYIFIQARQAKALKEKELELADARIAVMLSQIQPHFLYNVLTAIKQLCDSDPAQAKEAIVEFSSYLRGNLDSLTIKRRITFECEMEQVKNYLSLEKRRFGDKINIVYDISAKDFLIPPLTVQAIVENAVRHGITKKEGGGTLTISAHEEENAFVICVSDDGAGIDHDYLMDGNNHVGLDNANKRVKAMCGGDIKVKSQQGAGTEVTVIIPKGGAFNNAYCG